MYTPPFSNKLFHYCEVVHLPEDREGAKTHSPSWGGASGDSSICPQNGVDQGSVSVASGSDPVSFLKDEKTLL